jgi:hypothetical protein
MNIVVWLLEVDSIGLVEIQGRHGAKRLVLANQQYGRNFSSNNKTIGGGGLTSLLKSCKNLENVTLK